MNYFLLISLAFPALRKFWYNNFSSSWWWQFRIQKNYKFQVDITTIYNFKLLAYRGFLSIDMNPQSSPFPLLCFSLTIFLLSTGYNLGSTEMISFQLTLLPYISLKLQASSVNIYESTKFPFSRVPLFIFLIGTGYNSGSIEMIGFKLTLLPYTIFILQSYRGILSIDVNQQSYKS